MLVLTFFQTIVLTITLVASLYVSTRQLRAYVSVTPVGLIGIPGNFVGATFVISNEGATPAYRVRHVAALVVLPHPLSDRQGDLFKPHRWQRKPNLTLHSHQNITGEADIDAPLSAEDFARASTEGHRLYLAGIVHYSDVFRLRHKTQFCAYIDAAELRRITSPTGGARFIQSGKLDWMLSHVHNAST